MLLIAVVRVLGSLPVLRWPFYGGLLALVIDQVDVLMMQQIHLGGVTDYQTFDKYLDQVYLLTFLIVALRWDGWQRNVAVGLYVYRLFGFVAFEVTDQRDLLLLFPNFFEFWFLFIAAVKQFDLGQRWPRPAFVAAGIRSGRPEAIPGVRSPLPALAGQLHDGRGHQGNLALPYAVILS